MAILFLGVGYLVMRTWRVKKKGGFEDLMGHKARVTSVESSRKSGQIELGGEIWAFESHDEVVLGDVVRVTGYRGLVLKIKKE